MSVITFDEVRIPAHVLDANISPGAKMLYGMINAVKDTHSAINDTFFAEKLRVTVRTIVKYIGELVRNNLIASPKKEIARCYSAESKPESIPEPKIEPDDEISQKIAKWKAIKTPPYGIDVEAEIVLLESLRYPAVKGKLPPPMDAFMKKLQDANDMERHAKNICLYSRHRDERAKMEGA